MIEPRQTYEEYRARGYHPVLALIGSVHPVIWYGFCIGLGALLGFFLT